MIPTIHDMTETDSPKINPVRRWLAIMGQAWITRGSLVTNSKFPNRAFGFLIPFGGSSLDSVCRNQNFFNQDSIASRKSLQSKSGKFSSPIS